MFVIAFDLSVAATQRHHPKGDRQAYLDIKAKLNQLGFERVQGSVYTADTEDLANLIAAVDALRAMEWFAASVKNIRAFRMERGSDLTALVKSGGRTEA